jgi:hypothetical protein
VPTGAAGATGAPGAAGAPGTPGANGTNGADGTDGTSVLHWQGNDDFGDSISTTGTFADFFGQYTLAANELAAVGDEIEIVSNLRTANIQGLATVRVVFGATSTVIGSHSANFSVNNYELRIRVKRISANQVFVSVRTSIAGLLNINTSVLSAVAVIGSIDFTTTNLIKLQINQDAADYVLFGQFTIYKYSTQ